MALAQWLLEALPQHRKRRLPVDRTERAFYERQWYEQGIHVTYRYHCRPRRTFARAFGNAREYVLWWTTFRQDVTIVDERWTRFNCNSGRGV